jgi:hypothetical protein
VVARQVGVALLKRPGLAGQGVDWREGEEGGGKIEGEESEGEEKSGEDAVAAGCE